MSLNRLAVRAKKSISELLSISSKGAADKPSKSSQHTKENNTPEHDCPGASASVAKSPCPDVKDHAARSKDSPSRRMKLMGSLQRMNSLRNIRSSGKELKNHDQLPPQPRSPHTPTRKEVRIRPSLTLDFHESAPGQPMFDVSQPRRSSSLSLIVIRSSPVTVPHPNKQGSLFDTPGHSSVLPAGTVPDSPAPFRMAMDMDSTNLPPSPFSNPALELSAMAEPLPTPMPGTNLTLEDLGPITSQDNLNYFDLPLSSDHIDPYQQSEQTDGFPALMTFLEPHRPAGKPNESEEVQPSDRGVWRQANGMEGQRSESLGHGEDLRADRHRIDSWLEANKDDRAAAEQAMADMEMTNAAAGILSPNDDLETNSKKDAIDASNDNKSSPSYTNVGMARRTSIWGRHDGLYDGTGYGEETGSLARGSSEEPYKVTQDNMPLSSMTGRTHSSVSMIVHAPTSPRSSTPIEVTVGGHEILEEVIRAYSGYEDEISSSVTDKDSMTGSERDTGTVVVRYVGDVQ